MYRVRLIKARSYTGVIKATQERPDVLVEDKVTADAAVATGYFKLIGEVEPEGGETITGHLDRVQLEKLKLKDLKKLAEELGIDTTGFKKNSDYVDAIVAVEVETDEGAIVEPEPENDGDGETGEGENEADYGETE